MAESKIKRLVQTLKPSIRPRSPHDIEDYIWIIEGRDENEAKTRNPNLVKRLHRIGESATVLTYFQLEKSVKGDERSLTGGRAGALVLDHEAEDVDKQYNLYVSPDNWAHHSSRLERVTVPMSDELIGSELDQRDFCVRAIASGVFGYTNEVK